MDAKIGQCSPGLRLSLSATTDTFDLAVAGAIGEVDVYSAESIVAHLGRNLVVVSLALLRPRSGFFLKKILVD